jgi:hypothetical protein
MSGTAAKKAKATVVKRAATGTKSPVAGRREKKDLAAAFQALRALLRSYEGRLAAKSPMPDYYYLESFTPTYKKRPMFFAGVRAGKNYVSYHLMSVYAAPEMMKGMSPELKKRMQGKSCFNFIEVDEMLFKELRALTETGYKNFKNRGWV